MFFHKIVWSMGNFISDVKSFYNNFAYFMYLRGNITNLSYFTYLHVREFKSVYKFSGLKGTFFVLFDRKFVSLTKIY